MTKFWPMGNDGYNFGRIPEEEGLWGINRWETERAGLVHFLGLPRI
jgi:hypothetical protein